MHFVNLVWFLGILFCSVSGLAAKVQRHDSLAHTLNRQTVERNQPVIEVTSPSSDDGTLAARSQIGAKLNRLVQSSRTVFSNVSLR